MVQVDQPARHAQQHDAAAVVPAQAALRPVAVLGHVVAYGAAEVAARHVLRPASQAGSRSPRQEVLLECSHPSRQIMQAPLRVRCSTGIRTSLMSIICAQPARSLESAVQKDSGCSSCLAARHQEQLLLTGLHVKQAP